MRVGESCGVLAELLGARYGQHFVLQDQAFGTHARIEVEVDVTVLAADHTGRQLTVQRRGQAQGPEDRFRLFGVLLCEPRQHVGVEELLPCRGQQEQGVTTQSPGCVQHPLISQRHSTHLPLLRPPSNLVMQN